MSTIVADAQRRALEASKGRCRASQTTVAVECVDLATGARLVSLEADRPMIPASNLKVITAGAAALLGLGVDAEFETVFEAIGRIEDGQLRGDLVVRAGADPMHQREGDGGLSRWFDALESDLRAAGIESISGDVVLITVLFRRSEQGRVARRGSALAVLRPRVGVHRERRRVSGQRVQ